MRRIIGGVLVLVLALPALRADDEPKDKAKEKPPLATEQYQALLKEAQEAQQAFMTALREAKTQEERSKVMQEQNPTTALAPKFVALAEKYPKDSVALDALIWVMTDRFGGSGNKEARAKAIEILTRDHIQSEKLGRVCQSMANGLSLQNEQFLRAILEK